MLDFSCIKVNSIISFLKINFMKNSILIMVTLFCFRIAEGQVTSLTFDPVWAAKFQAAIDNSLSNSNFPGVSVAITFPGMGTFIGVGGESEPGIPVTSSMQFGVGSNAKLFTAVLALKLQ